MNHDFEVNFGQIFPLQILQWPDGLKLQVIYSTAVAKKGFKILILVI